MQSPSVIGIFCEDIREEKSGQPLLIGILPDNVDVRSVPGAISKLGVYVRIHLDAAAAPPKTVTAKMVMSDGTEQSLPSWDRATIDNGFVDAKKNQIPLVGLVLQAMIAPVPINKTGLIVAKITIDGTDYIAANINIIASATASAPPASQSSPAAPPT